MGRHVAEHSDPDRDLRGIDCSRLLELLRRGGGSIADLDSAAAEVIHDFHTMRSYLRNQGLWEDYARWKASP